MNFSHGSGIGRIPVCVLALALSMSLAFAQSQANDDDGDKSGTDPTKTNSTFNLQNEYKELTNGKFSNTTTLRYTTPVGLPGMSLKLSAPLVATNTPGGTHFGIGDISAKLSWVVFRDNRQGLVLSGEIAAPSANQPFFGTGKWVASPGIVYAVFLSREIIVAPAYIHNVSIAGDSGRTNINRGDFDLYVVYKPMGQNWWLTSDLAISYDYLRHKKPASWKLALGTNIGRVGDAAVNLSLKPGIGIGVDKPFKWSFEVGLAVVGF